jgi:molybdate transport system substrate-binding protein
MGPRTAFPSGGEHVPARHGEPDSLFPFSMTALRRLLALLPATVAALAAVPLAVRAQDAPASEPPVVVYAAASLTDVLQKIARDGGFAQVRFSFAASSTLARQIEQGAPAQIFVSADEAWMDAVQRAGRLVPGSRRDWTGNRLALVAAGRGEPAAPPEGAEAVARPLRAALADPEARIATGDPAHVPVGQYAQSALASLGLAAEVMPRLARADNVRSALALVERGEAPLGIVYRTDALQSGRVRTVALFPATSHAPIRYPAALLVGATPAAQRFYRHLFGDAARAALAQAGFSPP